MRSLALSLLLVAVLSPRFAHAYRLDDSLRGSSAAGHAIGGSFDASGWTATGRTDRLWWAIPRLVSGSVEFTVSNISLANLTLVDHEIFSLYEDGYGIGEPIAYAPYRDNHYKAMIRIYGQMELPADRVGRVKMMWGICPSGDPGHGACGCASFFEEPLTPAALAWDGSPHRMRIEWGGGVSRLFRDGVEILSSTWTGYDFGPSDLHIALGSSRADAVGTAGMPIGAVFSDVVVDGTEGPLATCGGSSTDGGVITDAASLCSSLPVIEAISLTPTDGSGTSGVLRAVYRHCAGAASFRVAQLRVADGLAAGVPAVAVGYEAGMLGLDAQQCAPGEARVLTGAYGSLDCARTTVSSSGDDLTIDWALGFDGATFSGTHGVYFDAKGPSSVVPEPRLGWLQMGTFTVPAVAMDAGLVDASSDATAGDVTTDGARIDAARADAARPRDAGGSGTVGGGCGCATVPVRGRSGAGPFGLLVAMAAMIRRRRHSTRSNGSVRRISSSSASSSGARLSVVTTHTMPGPSPWIEASPS
ncbi:MAG: hypothetical protein WCJ30_16235 [Deltaproteobacteria bacterium]